MGKFNRKLAARKAIQVASQVRATVGVSQHEPICVYDVCDRRGVTVRFNDINMEGMYQKGEIPRIHLSSKRPMVRRAFNCGHELGHHEFGHGSHIDEMRSDDPSWEDEEEFLANTFSSHLLMPLLGVRAAFNLRNIKPDTASPLQLYDVSGDFGVGYETLITHLSVGLNQISASKAKGLRKHTPQRIREELICEKVPEPLIFAGQVRSNQLIDTEVGGLLLLPHGTEIEGERFKHLRDVEHGALYKAESPGISRLENDHWSAFTRVSRSQYIGLAKYRHLEEVEG